MTTWYTLVRFKDDPQHLTGISQAKNAGDALRQLDTWEQNFPDHTAVVFDPMNAPVQRPALVAAAAAQTEDVGVSTSGHR